MSKAWYVIHTRTGYEDRVLKTVQEMIDSGEGSRQNIQGYDSD